MPDHIPFEIQVEIMKRLPVNSLIRFRLVSKPWKSLIESSSFINNYHINNTQPQHHLFVQYCNLNKEQKYISIQDDNTFPNQRSSLGVPGRLGVLGEALALSSVNGLLCFYGLRRDVAGQTKVAVLWNPTIRKSVRIPIPNALSSLEGDTYIGFGICPNTSDPKLVRINTIGYKTFDWEVKVYMLSSRVWKSISNIPPAFKSCDLKDGQVFVGGFIYLCAQDGIRLCGGRRSNLIVSFDLKNDEFDEVCLPDRLVQTFQLGIMKINESLGLLEHCSGDSSCVVWVMKEGVTKMFSIKVPDTCSLTYKVLELRKNNDAIFENSNNFGFFEEVHESLLVVYEPCSGQTNGIGINGICDSFSVKSYMETLLLLDHSDSIIH